MDDELTRALRRLIREEVDAAIALVLRDWTPPTQCAPQAPASEWLSTTEAARYLGIKVSTLRNLIHAGDGPEYRKFGRLNRFRIADLDRYIQERLTEPERGSA